MKKFIGIFIALMLFAGIFSSVSACHFKKNKMQKLEIKTITPESEVVVSEPLKDDGDIAILPTMNTKSSAPNRIWVGTFQIVWNEMVDNIIKHPVEFVGGTTQAAKDLNAREFNKTDISESSYYTTYGIVEPKLKTKIEKAIKDKFNETSDILDDFDWENRDPLDFFLYVMLKKDFQFEKAFEELENGKFGNYDDVKYFGIKSDESGELRQQVDVLYYKSKDDFAIKLRTKQEDEVILCKNPEGKTFGEIYNNILEKTEVKVYNMSNNQDNYESVKLYGELKEGEILKVPNIKIKEKNEIKEIENKKFEFSNGNIYSIEKALQTIEFELDRTGGKIKSEAGMMVKNESVAIMDEIREFSIDDTFAIFLIEKGKDKPYFAGKIEDINERKKFLDWLWDFEFNLYKIPVPTKCFFLNMPPKYSLKLIENRENKYTHESNKDIHENDTNHIVDSYNAACSLANQYGWYEVKCVKNGKIRTIEEIHEEIFKEILQYI